MKRTISIILGILSLSSLTAYAAFSTDVFQPQQTYSGVNSTSSPSISQTLVAGDVVGYSTIVFTPTVGSDTITLPASSTLSTWLPTSGLRLSLFILDASTTNGINLTISGNTSNGSILENASTTSTITSSKGAILEVMRKPNTDFLWTLVPAI